MISRRRCCSIFRDDGLILSRPGSSKAGKNIKAAAVLVTIPAKYIPMVYDLASAGFLSGLYNDAGRVKTPLYGFSISSSMDTSWLGTVRRPGHEKDDAFLNVSVINAERLPLFPLDR